MANPSKQRGTAAETAVVNYLIAHGFENAERLALHGGKDIGDVRACPGLHVEVKAHSVITDGLLAKWQAETATEKANANASEMVLVVKRPGKAQPGGWWAYRQHRNGFWFAQLFGDCVELLRLEGWGDPLPGAFDD